MVTTETQGLPLASLSDLGLIEQTITVTSPTGQAFAVRLRALSDKEIDTIRKSVPAPRRKQKDIIKTADGRVSPVYDDDQYALDQQDAANETGARLVAGSLLGFELPGDTLAEKADYLRSAMGAWALRQLADAVIALTGITSAEVERAAQD